MNSRNDKRDTLLTSQRHQSLNQFKLPCPNYQDYKSFSNSPKPEDAAPADTEGQTKTNFSILIAQTEEKT